MPEQTSEPVTHVPASGWSWADPLARWRPSSGWRSRRSSAGPIAAVLAAALAAVVLSGAGADAVRVATVFIGLGAVALSLRPNRWALAAIVLVGAWWLAVLSVRYLPEVTNPGPPVGQAVGAAAFFGTPYRGPQIAAVLTVALPTLIALVAAGLPALRRPRATLPQSNSSPDSSRLQSPGGSSSGGGRVQGLASQRALICGAVAVLAFALIPDLRSYLHQSGEPESYYWDSSNFIAWQLFIQLGLEPMKDFFFPYGFQWLYWLTSTGPLFRWLAEGAMLALAAWSLWRLSGRHTWRVILCLVALVLVGVWNYDGWRYVPAVLVATSYAAVGPLRHTRLVRAHAGFFAACLLAVFVGPDILVIGLGGTLMVLAGELASARTSVRSWRFPIALGLDAVPVVASVALIVLVWVILGTTTANARFLTDFAAISSSSALNEHDYGPLGLMVLYPAAYSIYAATPALLAGAGLLWMRVQPERTPRVGAILLAGSGVSLVMLLKHFVRPIFDEMLIAPLITIAWAVILVWPVRSVVRGAVCGAALGAFLTLLHVTARGDGGRSPDQFLTSAVSSPAHLVRSVSVILDPAARARAARARFDPSRFLSWPDTAIATDYLVAVHAPPVPQFAIVGDSAMTYALLPQRPPFHVELYDAAPIAEQNAMVALLERRHPPYLIWRKDYNQDGVPYVVRDPIVFAWMIENYVPVRVFGIADVLRRRAPGEQIPGPFWRSQLGGTEDFGYIPSFSGAASAPLCVRGPGCMAYVVVRGQPHGGNPGIGVVVSGNGVAYGLNLRMRAGAYTYPIRLDRIWFSPLVGPHPAVSSLTPGFSAQVVGLRSGENLY